jgi:hypothetical protein
MGRTGLQKKWLLGTDQIGFGVLTIDLSDTESFKNHLCALLCRADVPSQAKTGLEGAIPFRT